MATHDKWTNLGPARGMGGLYSHIEGFSTGTQLLHVAPKEAQLLSAAPELLEALKEFSDYVHSEQCATDGAVQYGTARIERLAFIARAAIAKATGCAA